MCFSWCAATAGVVSGVVNISSGFDLLTESNNQTGQDVILASTWAAPVWAAPTAGLGSAWISYAQSGPGGVVAPEVGATCEVQGCSVTIDPNAPTAIFSKTFYLPAPAYAGSLSIWADDTASVFLDGVNIIPVPATQVRAMWCTEGAIGCGPSFRGAYDLSHLAAGSHTLDFYTYQIFGDSFGLLYEGTVSYQAPTPEPSTLLLPGAGAALLLFGRRKRY